MKNLSKKLKALWTDESAQGSLEYILVIVIAVALAMFFGPEIKDIVKAKTEEIKNSVSGFNP